MNSANESLVVNAVLNANVNSTPSAIVDIYGFAIQAVIIGTPTGVLKLQASCDPFKYVVNGGAQVPTNWVDIPDSSFTVTTAGTTIWNYNGAFYTFVRCVYTDSSSGASTAVLNVKISVKG